MFKSKKLIATLMVVAMLLTLIPMTAFAATGITATAVPVVTKAAGQNLGSIRIVVPAGSPTAGEKLTVTLPSDVVLPASTGGAEKWGENVINDAATDEVEVIVPDNYGSVANGLLSTDFNPGAVVRAAANKLTLTIKNDVDFDKDALIIIKLTNVDLSDCGNGSIDATLDASPNSGIPTGTVAVGTIAGSDAVKLTASSIDTATAAFGFTLNITEEKPGAIANGDTIKLKLPDGYAWSDVESGLANDYSTAGGVDYSSIIDVKYGEAIGADLEEGTTERDLVITFKGRAGSVLSSIAIPKIGFVVVDDTKVKNGDIEVSVSGSGLSRNVTKLVVGKRADFEITMTCEEAPTVYAGKQNQEIGDIVIKEGVAGSLLQSRTITLKLPSNARWQTAGTIDELEGTTFSSTFSSDNKILVLTQTSSPTTVDPDTITLEDYEIQLEAGVVGDVVVEVTGSQGIRQQLVVAKAVKPATIEAAEVKDIIIGRDSQDAGSFTIKEVTDEMLENGNLTVVLPTDVEWAATPTVTVKEGDISLGTVSRNANVLTIPVSSESMNASTIEVTGVKLKVYRTVPEGDVFASLRGAAVVETTGVWTNSVTADKAVIAKVITPAPGELMAKTTAFVIGSTTYKVDDVEKTMDVAPYIKDSRTFVPVRFAAQAMGVADKDIIWDAANSTATIFKGDRIIQMTIGSNIMTVNGVQITMDTAPEIVNNRTMLPVGWLAQALNVVATWDGAAQTATLTQAAVVE